MLNVIEFLCSFAQIKIARNREPNTVRQYLGKFPGNVTIKHIVTTHTRYLLNCVKSILWLVNINFTQINMAVL